MGALRPYRALLRWTCHLRGPHGPLGFLLGRNLLSQAQGCHLTSQMATLLLMQHGAGVIVAGCQFLFFPYANGILSMAQRQRLCCTETFDDIRLYGTEKIVSVA